MNTLLRDCHSGLHEAAEAFKVCIPWQLQSTETI
jgi:hypothetical protein